MLQQGTSNIEFLAGIQNLLVLVSCAVNVNVMDKMVRVGAVQHKWRCSSHRVARTWLLFALARVSNAAI